MPQFQLWMKMQANAKFPDVLVYIVFKLSTLSYPLNDVEQFYADNVKVQL